MEKSFVSAAERLLTSYAKRRDGRCSSKVTVNSCVDMPRVLASGNVTALLSPSADPAFALSVRDTLVDTVSPVLVVSHGVSDHEWIYDWLLRLLLKRAYQCDSISCTSIASRSAMERILEHVRAHFSRDCHCQVEYGGRLEVIPLPVDT